MDLRNNQITVREILQNPGACKIFDREFPGLRQNSFIQMAYGMTLAQVLHLAAGRIPADKVGQLLEELRAV